MEKERRQIDLDEPGAPLLLRYLKGEVSEEEKCRLGAWMEADAAHEQLLRQTARTYYAHRMHARIAARDTSTTYEKVCSRLRHRRVVGQLKKYPLSPLAWPPSWAYPPLFPLCATHRLPPRPNG